MENSLVLVLLLSPFIGFLINVFFGKQLGKTVSGALGTLAVVVSFLASIYFFVEINQTGKPISIKFFDWISLHNFKLDMGILLDQLSLLWLLFVTGIGSLIHLYSISYMHDDEHLNKFFAYLNLFVFFMITLVVGSNLVIMFIGWEGVGLCSYLLIGFWYKNQEYNDAAKKAFIMNRIGDLGFLIGIFILGSLFSTLDFSTLKTLITSGTNANVTLLSLAALSLFIGATGKSAQIPLYTWLPDAMAGPTPVSALIHAATMVTAGVYMVARFNFLYTGIEEIGIFIAYIGAFSALLAAIIATKQTDIKKILAYSTMSQLGYMFIAVGLGFYSSGLFHVFTHAFFKAMLFMGAGGVIIALHHEQNIFNIAKHRAILPIISATFLIGVIAISGIPPFSGFFSKDAILAAAFQEGHYLIYGIALFTAFLTAFYMFRLYFVVFVTPNHHKKEYVYTSKTITFPLVVLAVGAVTAGFLNLPSIFGGTHMVDTWLGSLNSKTITLSHSTEYILMALSVLVASFGIFIAYKKYARFDLEKPELEVGFVGRKLYVDELYDILFVKTSKAISCFIDKVLDAKIIDAFIMKSSIYFVAIGRKVALIQNANVRFYALFMLAGMTCIFVYLYLKLGL